MPTTNNNNFRSGGSSGRYSQRENMTAKDIYITFNGIEKWENSIRYLSHGNRISRFIIAVVHGVPFRATRNMKYGFCEAEIQNAFATIFVMTFCSAHEVLLLMDCNTDEEKKKKKSVAFYTPLETNSIENWVEVTLCIHRSGGKTEKKTEIKRISIAHNLQCRVWAPNNRQPKWILI